MPFYCFLLKEFSNSTLEAFDDRLAIEKIFGFQDSEIIGSAVHFDRAPSGIHDPHQRTARL